MAKTNRSCVPNQSSGSQTRRTVETGVRRRPRTKSSRQGRPHTMPTPDSSGHLRRHTVPTPDPSGHIRPHTIPTPNSNGHRRPQTVLTPLDGIVGTGFAGSSSRSGGGDPMADMEGVFRHNSQNGFGILGGRGEEHADDDYSEEDEEENEEELVPTPRRSSMHGGSNAGDFVGSEKPVATRSGKRFGDRKVHTAIIDIFWDFLSEPWPTFKKIPRTVVKQMFEHFRTKYQWHPDKDSFIFEGFIEMLKHRYRDRLSGARRTSGLLAIAAGRRIPVITENGKITPQVNDHFGIIRDYPLTYVHLDVWQRLCDYWDTDSWKKISMSGKRNRNSADRQGVTARHTGGSIGFDEHRNRLRKLLGREPTWLDVYLQTHLTKESKAKYFSGNSEGLRFISETAKEAYEAYTRAVLEKYGEDEASQIIDDSELWCDTQLQRQGGKGKNRIYGIGSANAHYVVTGKYSPGSDASSTLSQEEVKNLKEELETYKVRTKHLEEQMEAFMRRYPPPSPPPNGS